MRKSCTYIGLSVLTIITTLSLRAIADPTTAPASQSFSLTPLQQPPAPPSAPPSSPPPNHFGLFNALDRRSTYGSGFFPEPFLNDDSDEEINEARVDWLHQEGAGQGTDLVTAEVEKGFGTLTAEVEFHFERDYTASVDPLTARPDHNTDQGIGNVDLGVRFPLYQYVSDDASFDTTFGAALEVGVPTNSPVSKNTEVVPKIFNDTKFGDHLSLQSIAGYSILYGGADDGGDKTLEFGADLGYAIASNQIHLPGILQTVPVFEFTTQTPLNKSDRGHPNLSATAAIRFNLESLGKVQPRLGIGYTFPLNREARQQFKWAVITSLVFEF